MTDAQALAAIAERTAKGWSFMCQTRGPGWECNAIGAGLARATCGGKTFGDAVGRALGFADEMEDDPQVIIDRYSATLKEQMARCFGPETEYVLSVQPSSYDFDAKKIHLSVLWKGSAEDFCRRDDVFRDWFLSKSTPQELLMVLMVMPEFMEETPAAK